MTYSLPSLTELNTVMLKWVEQLAQAPAPTEEKKKEIYYIAYALYRDKCYKEAIPFFRFLTIIEPGQLRYWKALAASLQMSKDYHQAICCYGYAQALNENRPDPYLDVYQADCYFALRKAKQGLEALKAAERIAKQHKQQQILDHVAFMRTRWSSEK